MIKKFLIMILFILSLNGFAAAHTGGMVSYTCPLDNNTFEQFTDFSGTSFDSRLDFKKTGPIADPWAVPRCTKCGFILYKKSDEFTAEEIADLKKYIFSGEYKKLKDDNSTYYCLGKIMEYLKRNDKALAWIYLQASWQVESGDMKKYREYVLLSLSYFNKVSQVNIPPEKFIKSQGLRDNIGSWYMCIELNRRLGNFVKADEYMRSFPGDLLDDEKWIMEFTGYEKELIAAKDDKPYGINELRKKKNPEKK
jgi:hypothetical protein